MATMAATTKKKTTKKVTKKSTAKSVSFSPEEICSIIETCSKSFVKKINLGGVEIEFQEAKETIGVLTPQQREAAPRVEEIAASAADHELIEDLSITQHMIDDPEAHEQDIINGLIKGPTND